MILNYRIRIHSHKYLPTILLNYYSSNSTNITRIILPSNNLLNKVLFILFYYLKRKQNQPYVMEWENYPSNIGIEKGLFKNDVMLWQGGELLKKLPS